VTAINLFQAKYGALPGDMNNASTYWGSAGGCWSGNTFTGQATCNGNGNGQIEGLNGNARESILMWHHLANAGMAFPLTAPGNTTTYPQFNGTEVLVPGFNVPQSKYPGVGYAVVYVFTQVTHCDPTTAGGESWGPDQCNHNAIAFAGSTWSGYGGLPGPVIPCSDIQQLDNKFDDGKPWTGNIQNPGMNLATCAHPGEEGTPFTATYDPNHAAWGSALVFPHEIDPWH
jgi:hypothetical protein